MNSKEMRAINTDRIIHKIAEENGVTSEEVKQDMQTALSEGFNNPDPQVRAIWEQIPREGEMPTIEEFLLWASQRAKSHPNKFQT